MKKVMLLSFALLAATVLKGQDSTYFTNSNVFVELGGPGIVSANYERLFPLNEVAGFSGRAGLGLYPTDLGLFGTSPSWSEIVPLMFNFIYGRDISLEAGFGLSLGFDDAEDAYGNSGPVKWYNGSLGLRYQNPNGKGFLTRIVYTPIITFPGKCQNSTCTNKKSKIDFLNFFGISLGIRIKSKKKR